MWIELLIVILLLVYLSWEKMFGTRPRTFPPGPMRFPIVGNLPLLGNDPLKTLSRWKTKYGNIVGLRFGDFNIVMLCDYELIKEGFDLHEFSGRPKLGPFILIAGEARRGLLAEGPGWSEQRRFALRNLRDFGFGKKSMEGLIQEDASEFIQSLKKENGQPISTHRRLSLVVLNALWNIIAGERFSHDDPKFKNVLDSINAVLSTTSISSPVFFLPWLAKLAPKLTGWDSFAQAVAKAKNLIREVIKEHNDTFDKEDLRDFMDVYLNEVHGTVDPNSSFYKDVGEENMLVGMLNLFGAGAETTSNTLNWAFYFLASNPQVQKRMFEEIDSVVGQSRLPNIDDRGLLMYIEAVMLEVFRKSSIVPFGVFHSAMEDVIFHGHAIPKGTTIMGNLYGVHHDESHWGDPEVFRPERFISKDGKRLEKVGHVIPFSIGKRSCLGETLARTEFYILLTSVVQTFKISFDPDNLPSETKAPPSLFRFPPPFKLIFKEREDEQ